MEPQPELETRPEVVITVCEPETGSSSGLRAEDENRTGTGREMRKLLPVTVEVPARNAEGFGNESGGCESPSTSSSFRSPVSRMLSFKRILSRERKGSVSPSSCGGGGCSSAAELIDAERGGREETQVSFSEFGNRS